MLESLSRSRTGMRMALAVGRTVPRRTAQGVVDYAVRRMMADPTSAAARAARVNQYVVSGGTLAGEALEAAARANVGEMARFLYDLYHVVGRSAEGDLVVRDDTWRAFVERERNDGPFVYSGVHFGNFDLLGRQLGFDGWNMQILSVADPNAGYEWQNEMRAEAGFDVTPVTIDSLKHAARGLAEGHSVLTGHDRPLLEPDKVMPRFFGRPAPMPLLHVRLAMRAKVPVIALSAPRHEDGRYHLLASEPIEMVSEKDDPDALRVNAERCLAVAETWIAERPAQWAMPHVVWPDVTIPG
jgi:KDO2-lipid IV(A) lauroyltransferase